jgi:small neutral amino acid transporter SnatA (MarC family)
VPIFLSERLFGMVLVMISVQMLLNWISEFPGR